MNRIDRLIDMIKQSSEVKRYLELEKGINTSKKYCQKLDELKNIQIQYVKGKITRKEYEEAYQTYIELPFFSEYLELVEYLNSLFKEIKEILEEGLKTSS